MNKKSLGTVITVTAVLTAAIHLYYALFLVGPTQTLGMMFLLNFFGYVALLLAYLGKLSFLRLSHSLITWAFIAFTAVTILAWVAMGERSMLAYFTKLDELVLLVALFLGRR
ncbi:MAG: hypothetical protein MUO23_14255, partial [Anaerolineales bacterium]|nr:hypothetical protein [Anaerolineales bacterium]